MPNWLNNRLLKQRNIGKHWGRFALAGSQLGVMVWMMTLLMTSIPAYIPVSEWLMKFGIYIRFWMFLSIILMVLLAWYFISWKYLVASFYSSSTEQFWIHNNPLKTEIELLKEDNKEIKGKLDSILAEVKK